MKSDTISKSKKEGSSIESKKIQKEIGHSSIISSDADVSVFTKTTNPKVIIESEEIKDKYYKKANRNKHRVLKFLCLIIMCLIVLITFFLSIKTYNTVQELSEYFMS